MATATLVDSERHPDPTDDRTGGELVGLREQLSQSLVIEDVFAAVDEVLRSRGSNCTSLTWFYIGREFMQRGREAQDRELARR